MQNPWHFTIYHSVRCNSVVLSRRKRIHRPKIIVIGLFTLLERLNTRRLDQQYFSAYRNALSFEFIHIKKKKQTMKYLENHLHIYEKYPVQTAKKAIILERIKQTLVQNNSDNKKQNIKREIKKKTNEFKMKTDVELMKK